MKREFAEQIIKGEKKLEFRAYSQHYVDRLGDKETQNFIERHKDEPGGWEWCDALRQVKKIHFHNYNNTWTLDVECEYTQLFAPNDEGIEYTHDFGCYDFDEMNKQLKAQKSDRYPLFFVFELGKVIDRQNI